MQRILNIIDISKVQRISFRNDLNGLRAVAVLSVVFYHAEIALFQGGWLGVDIFFVISGYLITSLILKEIYNNNFSITNFYTRRIRRIIPVLFFVIISCIPVAYIFLLPSSLIDFLNSALSTLFFSSNLYFHHTGLIYGGPDSSLKPLLHTWSLSVEEQFYIIFPVILILSRKFLKNYILHLFIIFFFVSFISTQIISIKYPLHNFYFINVRIWELLAGSIIAYLNTNSINALFLTEPTAFFLVRLSPIVQLIVTISSDAAVSKTAFMSPGFHLPDPSKIYPKNL